MEKVKLGSYEQKLQDISLSDSHWKYEGPALRGLPGPHVLDEDGYVKSISLVSSSTDSHIVIRLQKFNPNRATDGLRPSNLLAGKQLSGLFSTYFGAFWSTKAPRAKITS